MFTLPKKFKALRAALFTLLLMVISACGDNSGEQHLAEATALEQSGDYAGALQAIKGAIRQDPNNAVSRARFSQLYLLLDKPKDARTQLDRALKLGINPSSVVMLDIDIAMAEGNASLALEKIDALRAPDRSAASELRKAQAHLILGESGEAQAIFQSLIERSDDLEPRLGFIRGAIAEDKAELALKTIDDAQALHPNSAELWLLKGSVLLEQDKLEAARTALLEGKNAMSVQRDPATAIEILRNLSEAQLSLEEFVDARVNINALRRLQPHEVSTWLLLATVNVAENRYDDALDIQRAILLAEPKNVQALMLAARTNYADGNSYQAETQLKRLLALTPDDLEASLMLSDILVRQGDALQALTVLDGLEKKYPESSDLLVRIGHARLSGGQTQSGIENFQKALQLDPGNTAAQLQLASGLLQSGSQTEARAVLAGVRASNEADKAARSQLMLLAHLNTGDDGSVAASVTELLQMHPEDADIHRVAAGFLVSQGAFDAAQIAIDRAAELAPESIATSMLSAGVHIAQGHVELGREELLDVLKRVPEHAVAMTALAKIELGAGKPTDAVRWLERARSSSRDDTEARFMLANLYMDDGKTIRAQTVLGELIELHPNNTGVKRRAARLYRQMGKTSKARQLLKSALRDANDDVADIRLTAASMAELGFKQDATRALAKARDLAPDSGQLAGDSAALSLASGQLERAETQIDAIRQSNPNAIEALVLDARLQAAKGNYSRAAELLAKALDNGAGSQAAVLRYQMLKQDGDPSALKSLEQYLQEKPNAFPVLMALAEQAQGQSQFTAAQRYYERAVQVEPAHPLALNNLAWIYLTAGDVRALDVARQAYRSAPGNPNVADTLGWTLSQLGKHEEALDYLRQADRLSQGNGEIRFHLAAALKDAGKNNEARQLLERLLATKAQFAGRNEAQQMLRDLQSMSG